MENKSDRFFQTCTLLCIGGVFMLFFLSLFLVKARQNIISWGRKISEHERILSLYVTKNTELDREILKLSSVQSLHEFIEANGLVVADVRNTVKVSKTDVNFYALNHSANKVANRISQEKFPKQTSLTMRN
jgi:cell division protein FtsL